MKPDFRTVLALGCFLLLGIALGFLHRVRHVAAVERRAPVELATASIEALVLLRLGHDEEATALLERHVRAAVQVLRHQPPTPAGRYVLSQAVPLLAEARGEWVDPGPPAPGTGEVGR